MIDLQRQAQVVAELQHRLDSFVAMAAKVEKEIIETEHLEKKMLDNAATLRRDRIVVSMTEYKAVLKDLYQVRQSMIRMRSYKLERLKEVENCTKALNQAIKTFEQAKEQQDKTVIHVDFRSKYGQG